MEISPKRTLVSAANQYFQHPSMNIEALILHDLSSGAPRQPLDPDQPLPIRPTDTEEEGQSDPDNDLLVDVSLPNPSISYPSLDSLSASSCTSTPTPNHYDKFMELCDCKQPCDNVVLQEISKQFIRFNEVERVSFLRSILFALSAPVDQENELSTYATSARIKKRRRDTKSTGRTTVAYAVKGRRLCRPAFAAVLNVSEKKLQRHTQDVANTPAQDIYVTKHNRARVEKYGVQTIIAHAFLKSYAANYGLKCPLGRGSQEESPLQLLPSDTSRIQVHEEYVQHFDSIAAGLSQVFPSYTKPHAPVSYNLFTRKVLLPKLQHQPGQLHFVTGLKALFLVAGHTKNVCDGAFGHVKEDLGKQRAFADGNDYADWNKALTRLLLFQQRNSLVEWKRIIGWQRIPCSFNLRWSPLCDVPSAKEGNRKQYLQVNILNKYYPNDNEMKKNYFACDEDESGDRAQ
eukprot:IDg3201t1